jgi:hypothetical protein
MEESRVTAFIAIYGNIVLANIVENKIISIGFIVLASISLIRYIYLIISE